MEGRMAVDSSNELTIERLLLERDVERFLYHEAELLDERRYDDWLDLIADDIRYYMPMRRNVKFGHQDRENTSEDSEISWFDEGKATLAGRVRQINTGLHWAEEPISRVCHMVSNVQVLDVEPEEVPGQVPLPGLPEPPAGRDRLLHRQARRHPPPGPRDRLEDRPTHDHPGSERPPRQERHRILLSWSVAVRRVKGRLLGFSVR